MRLVLVTLIVCLIAYATYEYIRIRGLIAVSTDIVERTEPFSGSYGDRSLLVLGDSTAYGVGASDPRESLPGRVAAFIGASAENLSKSGADVEAVAEQLGRASRDRYDVILVQVGGNDIVGVGDLRKVQSRMDTILSQATQRSDHVVLLTAGKVGKAPLFPQSLGWIFTRRAADLRERFIQIAKQHGVLYVDIYAAPDRFSDDPARYYAADRFHPSSAGYGLWFDTVKAAIEDKWPALKSAI